LIFFVCYGGAKYEVIIDLLFGSAHFGSSKRGFSTMGADYHYSRDGQSFGPVSVEQLRQLAAQGQISGTDLVWKEGMAEWVPAARFKGLIPAAPIAPMPVAQAAVVPSADAAHEFRLSEPAPAPVMPPAASFAKPRVESEPVDDATQAEVFARQAKEVALAAGNDAWKAFTTLAKNPVGGLRAAFEALGPSRAMQVGIVFAILFDLCAVFASHSALSSLSSELARGGHSAAVGWSFLGLIKVIFMGCVPYASAVGGFAAVRAIFKGHGSIQSDMFVAGASLLPAVILILAGLILGVGNFEIVLAIAVFAVTTTVLILYSGCTTLQGIPDAAATLAVPLMLLADMYICKIVAMI